MKPVAQKPILKGVTVSVRATVTLWIDERDLFLSGLKNPTDAQLIEIARGGIGRSSVMTDDTGYEIDREYETPVRLVDLTRR